MFLPNLRRWFRGSQRPVRSRKPAFSNRCRLGVEQLEDRAVPTFFVRISDGVNPIVLVADNSALDTDPLVGAITTSISLPNTFSLTLTSALSKPITGSPTSALINTAIQAASNGTAGGTLTVDVTDDNFQLPASPLAMSSHLGVTLPGGGTVNFQSFADLSNTPFGGVDPSPGPVTSTPLQTLSATGNDTQNTTVPGYLGGLFSVTNRTVIIIGANQFASTVASTQLTSNVASPTLNTLATPTGAVPLTTTAPTLNDTAVLAGGSSPTGTI